MSIIDPTNVAKPGWNLDVSNNTNNSDPPDLTANSNEIFVINDVVLEIPPTAISIQNEDLVWQWKTLRTKSSTKIPSGRGMCQVTLNVVFTPALLLHLHRLVVQFNHSPFCWIENRLLRESLVSHWPAYKNMAFTMTGLHINNLPGHPGSFNVQIDLRWFNYAPYGANYLFRRDWRTRPITDTDSMDYEKTISRFVTQSVGPGGDIIATPQEIQFRVPSTPSSIAQWSPIKQNLQIHSGFTLQQLKENHLGEVFDLLPLPSRMKKSYAVGNPAQSNIYVRYINNMQQKHLLDNFNIDVYSDLIDPEIDDVSVGDRDHVWEKVTVGELGGEGLVRGLHTATVPQSVRTSWIKKMLRHGQQTKLAWNEYISLNLGREINQKILDYYKELSSGDRMETGALAAMNVNRPTFSSASTSAAGPDTDTAAWPLVDNTGGINSPYGMRFHPEHKEYRFHKGIDMEAPSDSEVKAIMDGTVEYFFHQVNDKGESYGAGGYLSIRHSDDFRTRYMHLNEFDRYPVGTQVSAGQVIGLSGGAKTDPYRGTSTGPHLHFEVQIRDSDGQWQSVDPMPWLDRFREMHLPSEVSYVDPNPQPLPEDIPDEPVEPEENTDPEDAVRQTLGARQILTDEQLDQYVAVLVEMLKQGFTVYEGDNTVKNVYVRTERLELDLLNSDDLNGGSQPFIQHDAIVTSISGSLGHIVASIPIIGHEYPTHQHLGSIEPTYGIEFTCIDPNFDGLSQSGQMLQGCRSLLQENARKVRLVPGASCLTVDTFMTRLLGTHRETDLIYNEETGAIDHLPRAIISRSSTQTIEGSPGATAIYWDIQETNPYQEEYITPHNEFGEESDQNEDIYKEILQKLEVAGTSGALDSYGSKQLLLGLGDQVVGMDALKTIDPAAAAYFEEPDNDSEGARTFLVYRESFMSTGSRLNTSFSSGNLEAFNNDAELPAQQYQALGLGRPESVYDRPSNMPYRIREDRAGIATESDSYSRYEAWAEQNGILSKRIDRGDLGAAVLNMRDVTDLSMQLFESGSYQGFENMTGYGSDEFGGAFASEEDEIRYNEEVKAMWDEYHQNRVANQGLPLPDDKVPNRFTVVETTSFTNLSPSQETENRVQNYHRMLQYIKITADLIICEEEVNNGPYASGPMAFSASDVRTDLYDLDINPSMYGAYVYGVSQQFWKQLLGMTAIRGADDDFDVIYALYPWLKIDDNPDLQRWINTRAYYGVRSFVGDVVDLIADVITTIWRGIPFASAVQNIGTLGESTYDWNEALLYNNWSIMHDSYFDTHGDYMSHVFPLQGGIWQQNVVEEYFAGFDSKLGVQYGSGSIEGITIQGGEERFGINTFLSGFGNWYAASNWGMKHHNDSPDYNPITEEARAQVYKEYYFAAAARSAGIELENLDRMTPGGDPMYLWESSLSVPFENAHPPFFTTLTHEKVKIKHIKGLLKGLAQLVRGYPDVMEVLGIQYAPQGIGDTGSNSSGIECYPDLDLPDHPYYGNALYAMNPDFYYWNIYDDATGTLQEDILNRAEEAVRHAVEGPYNALKSMQRDGMDTSEYASAYGYIDVGDDTLVPEITRLISHPEGSDDVDMGWYPRDSDGRVWISTGASHQPIAATNVFVDVPGSDSKEISPEFRQYLNYGEEGLAALKVEVDRAKAAADFESEKVAIQEAYDKLVYYSKTQQVFPPLLSNWHGNRLYAPTGRTKEYYEELNDKVRGIETFFGSRLGYVGGLSNSDSDESDGLTDTRLASLAAYKMTFDQNSLKKLAIDSAKDILSQKYTMRRAFPTFKLFFVEEDQIYNRVLSFDDFHAFNGVKEFTVHQSRKNPADTATIVLQNISGTLDGTKRGAITDLDYYRTDESGNYKDPLEENLNASQVAKNSSSGDDPLTDDADRATATTPSWVDSQSQPFGAVILRPGLNVQLRVGYSNDPSMLNVLISGRVTDVQWSTNGDLVEIVVQSFGTELVKYLKGRGNYGTGTEGEDNREIYPTTHQLLSSLMLSSELKHFGRWTNSGIFQHGEARDASIDFTDYEGKSFFSNFKTTNAVLSWMYKHPLITTAGYTAAAVALHTPWGRGIGTVGRSLWGAAGSRLAAGRVVSSLAAGAGSVTARSIYHPARFIGTRFLNRRMSRVLGGQTVLGHTRTALGGFTGTSAARAASAARRTIQDTGAFNGIIGGMFRRSWGKASRAWIVARRANNQKAATAALETLVKIEARAVYTQAALLQFGIGSTTANLTSLTGGAMLGRALASTTAATFVGIPLTVAKLGAVTMLGLGGAELTLKTAGSWLYNNTIGAYKRNYALTKARLFLSPQDDNLYPPSPKDYMHFDYTSFSEDPGEWAWSIGKKAVFGAGQNLLYAVGAVSQGGVWAEDNTLNNWYEIWTGKKQPQHVLEKRVIPAQCHYHCDNSTIWDVFHEMTLRHPGWVYGARPYGTRFRYTMFFGVPSQRYWSKPASNTFIHRINKLRDYINVGVTEDSYKLLYGQNSVDRLRDELKNKLITIDIDDPGTYFTVNYPGGNQQSYETYEEAEENSAGADSIEMFNSDDESVGVVSELEAADLVIFGGGLDYRPGDFTLREQVSFLGLSNVEAYRYNQGPELLAAVILNPGARVVLFSKSAEQAADVAIVMSDASRLQIIEPYNDGGITQTSVQDAVTAGMPEANVMVGPDASRGFGIVPNATETASDLDHWGSLGSASEVYTLDQVSDPGSDNPYGRIQGEVTLGNEVIASERFEEELRMVMTNRVLEEYLLGLENRFVPFRRYHYVTSDADIVHNGIISSNKGVANAVSVLYQTPDSTPEDSSPGGVVEMKASARIPEEDIQMAPVHYKNCKGYTMGLRYGLGQLLYNMKEMYKGELLVLGNPRIRPWDICILRDEYNDMVGPVEVEAVVHMFSHETGYLTEIKPNAVVIANEISSYPILSALQLMCMAVEDNSRAKADMDTGLSDEEQQAYREGAWSQDLSDRYTSVFGENGFSLDELFPGYGYADMEQVMSGVDGGTLDSANEWKDWAANMFAGGVTGSVLGGAAFAWKRGHIPKSTVGRIGALALGSTAVIGSIALSQTVKSTSLQWFLAAPILFAQCLEQEAVSIVPLTKNGIPIVSGLSMRDPAMMWRAIFGRLYNFAQDTAIGLQDMSWYWDMAGDGWWENWVRFSSDEGYSAYREDFANSAGG